MRHHPTSGSPPPARTGRRRVTGAVLAALSLLVACSGASGEPTAADALDPVLLDYVASVDGDAGDAATLRFEVGLAEVKAKAIAPCLRDRGHAGRESALVTLARHEAASAPLPPLARIAETGGRKVFPEVLTDDLDAALVTCRNTDRSAASGWHDDAKRLIIAFVPTIQRAMAEAESRPVWREAEACMARAGAPAETKKMAAVPGVPADVPSGMSGFDAYFGWAVTPTAAELETSLRGDPPAPGPTPRTRALVRCMTPFFDDVERALGRPRAEFVERHHDALLDLQRRYESLGAPTD